MFSCTPRAKQAVYYDLEECAAVVQRCAITSSAVVFPTFEAAFVVPGEGNAYVEYSNADRAQPDAREEWRCYRNGEFRYRANFWELNDPDTQRRMQQKTIYSRGNTEECHGLINLVSLAYRVTAAHVFAARLLHAFSASVEEVKAGIDGVAGYGIGRIDLSQRFILPPLAQSNDCVFGSTAAEIKRAFDPYAMSAEALAYLFRNFGWDAKRVTLQEWLDDVRDLT